MPRPTCLPLLSWSYSLAVVALSCERVRATDPSPVPFAPTEAAFRKTFLEADDLPGLTLTRDGRGKAKPGERRLADPAGITTGEMVWEHTARRKPMPPAMFAATVVGGAAPLPGSAPPLTVAAMWADRLKPEPFDMVMDLRWVFPDEAAAEKYVKERLATTLSEKHTPVPHAPDIGDASHLFRRNLTPSGTDRPTHTAYVYIIRLGNVVVKLYRMQDVGSQPSPLKMGVLAHKVAERVRSTKP